MISTSTTAPISVLPAVLNDLMEEGSAAAIETDYRKKLDDIKLMHGHTSCYVKYQGDVHEKYEKLRHDLERRAEQLYGPHYMYKIIDEREQLYKDKAREEREAERQEKEEESRLDADYRDKVKNLRKEDLSSYKDHRDAALYKFYDDYVTAKKESRRPTLQYFVLPPDPPPPPTITDAMRFEHTHILGPSGFGKTTLIQKIILGDLKGIPPALIIIDPKGFMVDRISRMECFHQVYRDRLVVIDPTHDPSPPLNVFRQTGSRTAINYTVNNFDYLFAQAGSELTPMMRPVFRFCARLMFSIPNADILLLMDLLEPRPNDPRFQPYIYNLTDIGAKRFFAKDFYGEGYRATREQVKRRFNDILSMPEILAAFTSPSSTLDMGKALAERKIVLVNTGRNSLGPKESQLLGRYIISRTLGAAFARGINGPPAFLFIDEFQDFADEQATAEQLRLAREYNLGIIIAHQNMYCAELNDNLRNAISTNTTIKYCSKPEGMDKSYMARDFSCDTEFLDKHVKSATHANFACLVKGYPPFSVQVPFGNINPQTQMSDAAFADVLRRNQAALHPRVPPEPVPKPSPVAPIRSAPPAAPAPPAVAKPSPQKPGTDEADSW